MCVCVCARVCLLVPLQTKAAVAYRMPTKIEKKKTRKPTAPVDTRTYIGRKCMWKVFVIYDKEWILIWLMESNYTKSTGDTQTAFAYNFVCWTKFKSVLLYTCIVYYKGLAPKLNWLHSHKTEWIRLIDERLTIGEQGYRVPWKHFFIFWYGQIIGVRFGDWISIMC